MPFLRELSIIPRYMKIVRCEKLHRTFYERDPLLVSKDMLGKLVVRQVKKGKIVGEIVETEAYIGPRDKASHAYGNRKTRRTSVQFGERGHAYIYRIYGIYHCFCVTVGPPLTPAVTLVRAVRPVEGMELIRRNRDLSDRTPFHELTNGPSKFCKAFELTEKLNGIDLLGSELFLCKGDGSMFQVGQSARIGIDYAEEFKDVPWRFYKKDNEFVSKMRVASSCN